MVNVNVLMFANERKGLLGRQVERRSDGQEAAPYGVADVAKRVAGLFGVADRGTGLICDPCGERFDRTGRRRSPSHCAHLRRAQGALVADQGPGDKVERYAERPNRSTQPAVQQLAELAFKRLPLGLDEGLTAVGQGDTQVRGVAAWLPLHLEFDSQGLRFDPDDAWCQEEDFDALLFQPRFVLDGFALEPGLMNRTDAAMRSPSNYGPCWFHFPKGKSCPAPAMTGD